MQHLSVNTSREAGSGEWCLAYVYVCMWVSVLHQEGTGRAGHGPRTAEEGELIFEAD